MKFLKLETLGFNKHFQSLYKDYSKDGFNFARVSEVNKNNYMVKDPDSEVFAELTGKFIFNADSPLNIPTVGDWVIVQFFENKSHAIIHEILPRQSVIKRKDPAKNVEFQLIAANIDYAFIMQAADENFNLNRLERYLVMVNESNILPI
ncbi:MAG: GTPase RsgA, partial [Calditrichia bacterium]|nr:GTPase RsgA [Calditrichia bacterium]